MTFSCYLLVVCHLFCVILLWLPRWTSAVNYTNTSAGVDDYDFKYCTDIVFKDNDPQYIDLNAMLYNCMKNSPSSLFPPSYYHDRNNNYRATNVTIQIALNNIIHVDDVTSQFTVDFFFRLLWTDPRLALPPEFWKNHVHPKVQEEGLEIAKYFNLQNELEFWLPDIYFSQSTEVETLTSLVKLKENGALFWARQMIVTFSNPQMPFNEFPNDKQIFTITSESFSYDSDFILLQYKPDSANPSKTKPVVFLEDAQQNNKPLVKTNQIWKYVTENSFIITTEAPSPTNANRTYSTAFINLHFSRQSNGVIFRLALPVLIFLIIVGASFWSNENERTEVTLQIILVVSALYVIIGQSIPFVGYLTKMDFYVIGVFVILCVTISVHFFTTQLSRKAIKYPLAGFHRDAMVIMFRGFWMPLSVGLFVGLFGVVHPALLVILAFFAGAGILFLTGKVTLLIRAFYIALIRLEVKRELATKGALDEKTFMPVSLTWSERWMVKIAAYFQTDGTDAEAHTQELFKKYRPGLDAANGVTGISASNNVQPTTGGGGLSVEEVDDKRAHFPKSRKVSPRNPSDPKYGYLPTEDSRGSYQTEDLEVGCEKQASIDAGPTRTMTNDTDHQHHHYQPFVKNEHPLAIMNPAGNSHSNDSYFHSAPDESYGNIADEGHFVKPPTPRSPGSLQSQQQQIAPPPPQRAIMREVSVNNHTGNMPIFNTDETTTTRDTGNRRNILQGTRSNSVNNQAITSSQLQERPKTVRSFSMGAVRTDLKAIMTNIDDEQDIEGQNWGVDYENMALDDDDEELPDDQFREQVAFAEFKKTIAKEMGAVFPKKEQVAEFIYSRQPNKKQTSGSSTGTSRLAFQKK